MTVVVLGTGLMAAGIGAGFIAAGRDVALLGRQAGKIAAACDEARRLAAMIGARDAKRGECSGGGIDDWSGWQDATLVIEAISENLDAKKSLFATLDRRVPPGVPIGSNSSGFPISRIAAGLATRARMMGLHYFMPAHLVPLVEVVLGEDTDAGLAERVCALYRDCGKAPVLVRKDIPGFLANRIQHALMREALSLVERGIASPEDVDLAVRYSFGFRYAAVGPMLQKEISGWDTQMRAAEEIYPSLANDVEPVRWLRELVAAGRVGIKNGAGYADWTPESIAQLRADYERKLAAAFAILESDRPQAGPDDAQSR